MTMTNTQITSVLRSLWGPGAGRRSVMGLTYAYPEASGDMSNPSRAVDGANTSQLDAHHDAPLRRARDDRETGGLAVEVGDEAAGRPRAALSAMCLRAQPVGAFLDRKAREGF